MKKDWKLVVAHCNKLTRHADAYFVSRRNSTRAAVLVKEGKHSDARKAFFKKRK